MAWYPTASPGDTAGLERRVASLARVRRLALLAKTEDTATANDFGRELALVTMHRAVERAGGVALRAGTTVVCSMGCEGFTAPGVTLLAAMDDDAAAGPRVGGAASAPPAAGEIGEAGHVEAARATVAAAVADAGLAPAAVRLVLVKSPVLTAEAPAALPADRRRWRDDTGRVRGVAALGAGLAVGADGVVAAPERVVASRLEAGIAADGRGGGERTTVLRSEVAPDKEPRAAPRGFVAGILGHVRSFVRAGAEHRAPPGGGLFAAVVRGTP